VAGRAILWRGLVKENGLGGDYFGHFVALRAAYVLVSTAKREGCRLVMVKERGLPPHAGVTLRAARNVRCGELLSVDVLVTVFALTRSGLEVHVQQFGFKVGRLVAIDASRRAVRAEQDELCLRMVEAGEFLPRLRGVARLAAGY